MAKDGGPFIYLVLALAMAGLPVALVLSIVGIKVRLPTALHLALPLATLAARPGDRPPAGAGVAQPGQPQEPTTSTVSVSAMAASPPPKHIRMMPPTELRTSR